MTPNPRRKLEENEENDTIDETSDTPIEKKPFQALGIKQRREQVSILIIKGKFQEDIAKELNVSLSTIKRDCLEIKKGQLTEVAKILKSVKMENLLSDWLTDISLRRLEAWKIVESGDNSSSRVAALRELAALAAEFEAVHQRLGVKVSEIKPSELMASQIAVFVGAPPANYKLPEGMEEKPKTK